MVKLDFATIGNLYMAVTGKNGKLRIIGGKWRSRVVEFPSVAGLRPTSNRIRETLFNWLQHNIQGARCLDLYAGSGACGIEALSRGADSVDFVEANRRAAEMIKTAITTLGATNANVFQADALQWLQVTSADQARDYDVVFVDPPYNADLVIRTCNLLEATGRLKNQAMIYTESDSKLPPTELPQNWKIDKEKKAGAVYYYLLQRKE